ncbi:MAG: hypothetical protein GIKADHBN_01646 [Phycisphaerales bacterium]|nr:hypothetical protein [Phycisphaerales bacterium]
MRTFWAVVIVLVLGALAVSLMQRSRAESTRQAELARAEAVRAERSATEAMSRKADGDRNVAKAPVAEPPAAAKVETPAEQPSADGGNAASTQAAGATGAAPASKDATGTAAATQDSGSPAPAEPADAAAGDGAERTAEGAATPGTGAADGTAAEGQTPAAETPAARSTEAKTGETAAKAGDENKESGAKDGSGATETADAAGTAAAVPAPAGAAGSAAPATPAADAKKPEVEQGPIPAKIETLGDGSLKVDGRFVVKGEGTAEKPYEVTWDQLVSVSELYNPRDGKKRLPERVMMLDGKVVRIKGYVAFPMYVDRPRELLSMLNQWDGCCIGVPPTPFDAVEVKLRDVVEGGDRYATTGEVTGKFGVKPYLAGDWLVGLYVMDDAVLTTKSTAGATKN